MSDLGLSFEPVLPIGMIAGFVFATIAFLVALELKKKQKRATYRIAVLLLMLLSFLGLVMQPSFQSTEKRRVMLLTSGYGRSKADSILKLDTDLKILRVGLAESFPNSQELASYSDLEGENIKYVLGEGLPQYVWDEFSISGFVFLPARLSNGIIELNIPEMFRGRRNLVSGVFHAQHKTKLKLVGPSGSEDSTFIDRKRKSFSFSISSKQPGLFVYQIESEDSLGQKKIDRLPIEVKPEVKLRILFLQDFPSAEFRYLKNLLAEMGHFIITRTRTSKSNFIEEFINTPKIPLKNLSFELLSHVDLVLADSKIMESLTTMENSNLERAVQNGLGLMVTHGKVMKKSKFYAMARKEITTDTAHFQIGAKSYVLSALPVEIKSGDGFKSLLENRDRVLVGYQIFGAGKIGFQLLQETFRMKLEGNSSDYASVWLTLIEKIARRRISDFELKMDTYFPYYADEPIPFSVVSAGKMPEVFSDGIKIPLQEDAVIDDYWHGKTWGRLPGWHQLRTFDSTTLNYFVHEPYSWRSVRARYSTNMTRIARDKTPLKKNSSLKELKPVPSVLFYLIFLLAGGFLWLTPKI